MSNAKKELTLDQMYDLAVSGELEKSLNDYITVVEKIPKEQFFEWCKNGELPAIKLTQGEMETLKGGGVVYDATYSLFSWGRRLVTGEKDWYYW